MSASFNAGYWLGRQLPTVTSDPMYMPDKYDREQFLNGWRIAKRDIDAGVNAPAGESGRIAHLESENALLKESLRMHVEALKNANRISSTLRFELDEANRKLERARFLVRTGRAASLDQELARA